MAYYPVKRGSNNGIVPRKNNHNNRIVPRNNNGVVPITAGIIPNIFSQSNDKEKYKKGRAHCERIEQTAVYIDANGNKVMLKQNRLIMNADNDSENIRRRTSGKHLTARQSEVLSYVAEGKSNKQIAYEMGVSEATVKLHINALLRAVGATNRTQAVVIAQKMGII